MNTFTSSSNRPTPAQRQALYERAYRDAHALRQQALQDAAAWLADAAHALWQAARRRARAALRTTAREVATCPR